MKKQPPVFDPKTKQKIMIFILKVLSGEMYRAHSTGLETSRRCFRKNRPSPGRARTLRLISYSNEAFDERMRSRAHSALTAPLVLRMRYETKIIFTRRDKHFFDGLLSFFPGRYEGCARLCKLRLNIF
jgi:hypothetical protein